MELDSKDHEKLLFEFSEPVTAEEALDIARTEFRAEFAKRDRITQAIVIVLVVAFVTMLITVASLVIDTLQWRADHNYEAVKKIDAKNQEVQKEYFLDPPVKPEDDKRQTESAPLSGTPAEVIEH